MKKISEMIDINKNTVKPAGNVENSAGKATTVLKGSVSIHKSNDEKRLAFGWANVSITAGGEEIVDWQEDMIDPEELENAAYRFVEFYREGGEMHERGGCAVLVESVVFTEEKMVAMGIEKGILPIGWWIGFHVTDDEVWEKIKSGEYSMFSIEGQAERVKVKEDEL